MTDGEDPACLRTKSSLLKQFEKVDNFLVIEQPYPETVSQVRTIEVSNGKGRKISKKRWSHVMTWHIIEPCEQQLYVCMDLYNPHYQVSSDERPPFLKALGKVNHGKIEWYTKETALKTNEFLTVVNDMTLHPLLTDLSEHFTFDTGSKLVDKYKETEKKDAGRGNIFFDRGFSCGKNLGPTKDLLGLPVSRKRSVNTQMDKCDVEICEQAEEKLLKAMKHFLPSVCKGKESKLYMVPKTVTLVTKSEKQSFHAARYAKTDKVNVLNIHVDSQNPQDHENLDDDFMNKPVACFGVKKEVQRCTLIGYGQDSVVQSAMRYDKYGPCLRSIISFYNNLPEERKHTTPDLVNRLKRDAAQQDDPVRFQVHTDKMVYYSPFIDRLLQIFEFQNINIYYRIALLYLTSLCESPDLFLNATDVLLQDKSLPRKLDLYDFAFKFYDEMWQKKLHDAELRKDKKTAKLVKPVGQRHAPSVNKMGTKEGLIQSIKVMAAMHHGFKLLSV